MFLEQKGIFCTPVVPPATPQGEALIRTSYMATHKKEELSLVLEAFAEAKKKFDIPSVHLDTAPSAPPRDPGYEQAQK